MSPTGVDVALGLSPLYMNKHGDVSARGKFPPFSLRSPGKTKTSCVVQFFAHSSYCRDREFGTYLPYLPRVVYFVIAGLFAMSLGASSCCALTCCTYISMLIHVVVAQCLASPPPTIISPVRYGTVRETMKKNEVNHVQVSYDRRTTK